MKKLGLIIILAFLSLKLFGQTPLRPNDTPHTAEKNVDTTATVVDAHVDGNVKPKSAMLSDILVVNVSHWNSKLSAPGGIKQVRLFINSIEIEESVPVGWNLHGAGADVKFLLQRDKANNKTWNMLLGYPQIGPEFFDLPVSVSIGVGGQSPLPTTVNAFQFVRIDPVWMVGCIVVLAIYFWVLFRFAKRTPMLRDAPADLSPLGIAGLKAGNAPYSLGKVQMAFWFSIVLVSYVFIWLVTDNYELITSGTLVLIGIGAATGLGAISIDNNKTDGAIKQVQALQAQQAELRQANELLKAALTPDMKAKIDYNNFLESQLSSTINNLIEGLKMGKSTFFNDILADGNGVSFHRLQMVTFTLVLGFVFIYTAWATLSMPDFSATLLTMQGITSGTYLGFKIPEKEV